MRTFLFTQEIIAYTRAKITNGSAKQSYLLQKYYYFFVSDSKVSYRQNSTVFYSTHHLFLHTTFTFSNAIIKVNFITLSRNLVK